MIRAATEDDIPRILEIEREAISPPWTHGALLSEMHNVDTFFAVWDEGTVLAHGATDACGMSGVTGMTGATDATDAYGATGTCGMFGTCNVLGFVILRRIADESELYQIAVDKAHRRRGLAAGLMSAALAWAGSCGINAVHLEVRESNDAAISLYKKHGFIQTARRKGYYSDPTENAIMMYNAHFSDKRSRLC